MPLRLHVPSATDSALISEREENIRSFITMNEGDPRIQFTDDATNADVIVIFEKWSNQNAAYFDKIEECPFISENLRRIIVVNYDDVCLGFFPGCYVGLPQSRFFPGLHKAISWPHEYNRFAANGAHECTPSFLFSFCGTRSSPVRDRIFFTLKSNPVGHIVDVPTRFHEHSDEQKQCYITQLLNSHFILCPRGWGTSSFRLYEAMQVGRCPVIISDDWVPQEGIDWERFSIRIAERNVSSIPYILAERMPHAAEMGRLARTAWETYFSHTPRYKGYLDKILSVHEFITATGFDIRCHWRSAAFRKATGLSLLHAMPRPLFRSLRGVKRLALSFSRIGP